MQDRSVVVGEHTIKGAVNRSSSLNPRAIEYRHAGLGNHQIALFNLSQQRSKPVDLYPREYDAIFQFHDTLASVFDKFGKLKPTVPESYKVDVIS